MAALGMPTNEDLREPIGLVLCDHPQGNGVRTTAGESPETLML